MPYPCPYLNPYPYPYPYPLARTRAAPREGAHRENLGPAREDEGRDDGASERRATMGPVAAAAGGWDVTPRARGTTKDDAIRGARRRRHADECGFGRRRCSFLHQSTFGKSSNEHRRCRGSGAATLTPSTAALGRSNRHPDRIVTRPVARRVRSSRSMSAAHAADAPPLPGRLDPARTAVFVCDVQERFRTVIHGFDHCVHVSSMMLRAGKILGMPAVVTEQYPERLGATVDELAPNLDPRAPPVAKKLFSMITPEVDERLGGMNRDQAVLMGLESHVCVFQTAMDLMARGGRCTCSSTASARRGRRTGRSR